MDVDVPLIISLTRRYTSDKNDGDVHSSGDSSSYDMVVTHVAWWSRQ
jgi:hypothetical protein